MKIKKWVKEESQKQNVTVAERGKVTKTKRNGEVVKLKKIEVS
jgi:hypothetical protein